MLLLIRNFGSFRKRKIINNLFAFPAVPTAERISLKSKQNISYKRDGDNRRSVYRKGERAFGDLRIIARLRETEDNVDAEPDGNEDDLRGGG